MAWLLLLVLPAACTRSGFAGPPSALDANLPLASDGARDAVALDLGLDAAGVDTGSPDAAGAETGLADAAVGDRAATDASAPDLPAAEGLAPDAPAVADVANVDGASADSAPGDGTFDASTAVDALAAVDGESADSVVADSTVADSAVVDSTIDGSGAADGIAMDSLVDDGTVVDSGAVDASGADAAAPEDAAGNPNTPPEAAILVSPGAGSTSTSFLFSAATSEDLEDSIDLLAFDWDWDDDGVFDASGRLASHVFASPGLQQVSLRVNDSGGLSDWAAARVAVTAPGALIEVTTGVDEADPGASPGAPGSTGLSLREAMQYASAQSGGQTILVPSGTTVALTSTLPDPTNSAGITIVGAGAHVDGTAGSQHCFYLSSSNNALIGLDIGHCVMRAIVLAPSATNNAIYDCVIHDNGDLSGAVFIDGPDNVFGPGNYLQFNPRSALHVNGARTLVQGNYLYFNGAQGIMLDSAAGGSALLQNVVFENGSTGVQVLANVSDLRIQHNTIAANVGVGLMMANNVAGVDLRNNVIVLQTGVGLQAREASFVQRDYNDLFGNSAACNGCTLAPVHDLAVDPAFIQPASERHRLRQDSPLVDVGVDLLLDLNGPAPGRYGGLGPDLGARETP